MERKSFNICLLIYFAGLLFFLFKSVATVEYFVVYASYIVVGCVILLYVSKRGLDILLPETWFIIITFFTYSVGPMTSILLGDETIEGFYVFDGCIYGTFIYIISFLSFMLVLNTSTLGTAYQAIEPIGGKEDPEGSIINRKPLIIVCFLFVAVGSAVAYYSLLRRGLSLQYILSLGTNMDDSAGTSESIGGLFDVIFFMFIPLLLLDKYMENRVLLWVLRILALIPLLVRGNRFLLLMYFVPLFIMHYLKRNTRPSKKITAFACIIVAISLSGMQLIRTSLRLAGNYNPEANTSNFDFSYIWNSIQINLDMYKTLYGACTYFPTEHMYTFGSEMILGTITKLLPSSWRPDAVNTITNLRVYFMGGNSAAWTYGQLTEYYFEFGVIGCVVFTGIFAKFCIQIKKLIFKPNVSFLEWCLYAQMIPMVIQFVIRGQMMSNFWVLIFMLVPYFVIKKIYKN